MAKAMGTTSTQSFKYLISFHLSYAEAMDKLFLPIAREYQPELILISAGFDAARGDPLGELDVTEEGFSLMTSQLLKEKVFQCVGKTLTNIILKFLVEKCKFFYFHVDRQHGILVVLKYVFGIFWLAKLPLDTFSTI